MDDKHVKDRMYTLLKSSAAGSCRITLKLTKENPNKFKLEQDITNQVVCRLELIPHAMYTNEQVHCMLLNINPARNV